MQNAKLKVKKGGRLLFNFEFLIFNSYRRTGDAGQFLPITGLVMLTTVIFMVSAVNVYRVTRAKLKAQNIANAVATNMASQQAQAFNAIVDRNEWLNHMVAGMASVSDQVGQGWGVTCPPDNPAIVPGLSCVENTYVGHNQKDAANYPGHVFHSKDGATNYGVLVKTINDTQKLFLQAYDTFLGANANANTSGPASLMEVLKADFGSDLDAYQIAVWNTNAGEPTTQGNALQVSAIQPGTIQTNMTPLSSQFQIHDIHVVYYQERCLTKLWCIQNMAVDYSTLGDLANNGQPVGWMEPKDGIKQLTVRKGQPGVADKIGVGAMVSRSVHVPLIGDVMVSAKSKAYVVEGSGANGIDTRYSSTIPVFRPTFWVKLAN